MKKRPGNGKIAREIHKTQGVLLLQRTGEMDLGEGELVGCQNRLTYYLIYKIDNIC